MRRYLVIAVLVLLAACSQQPKTTAGLGQEMPLQAKPGDLSGNTLVYRAPDLDPRKYRGLYIAPVGVYDGTDTEWGGTDMATRQRVAARLGTEVQRALRAKGAIVLATPAPGSVTVELTLAGITSTHGVAANALKVTPIGFGLTLMKSAAGLPASFTGSITVAGKLLDSRTHEVLAGFVSKESPTALDPRTLGGTEETAMLAATKAADDFAAAVARARQAAMP